MQREKNKIIQLYEKLYRPYKKQQKEQWGLWCKKQKTKDDKEQIIIGAILAQRTNWRNAELALANLRKAEWKSLKKIYELSAKSLNKLAKLIRPAGFYKTKARYLLEAAKFFSQKNIFKTISKMSAADLRPILLKLPGLGKETADSILLYALHKPIFVIDEYTRRLIQQEKISRDLTYDRLQVLFEKSFQNKPSAKQIKIFQDFHSFIVINGKITNNVIGAKK